MSIVGYPWVDGGSLISTELNSVISHTTLRLHASDEFVKLGSVEIAAAIWYVYGSGTSATDYRELGSQASEAQSLSHSFLTATDIPATASWAIHLQSSVSHAPNGTGSSCFRMFVNGAWWDSTNGSTFSTAAVSPGIIKESIRGVGPASIAIHGTSSASTGSAGINIYDWGYKPVNIVPLW